VPSYYLRYYYAHDEVLREQQAGPRRAEAVQAVEKALLEIYADLSMNTKPEILAQRGGAFYSVADDIRGLISAVAGYERLALDAALHGGRERVVRAMLAHPLVGQFDKAERLTDLLLAGNSQFLPWAR